MGCVFSGTLCYNCNSSFRLSFVANQTLQSLLTAIYVVAGVIGSVIITVVVVCITVHVCQRCRRTKHIDVASSSSSAHVSPSVDCQYVTLQTNEVAVATPSAPPTEYDFLSADNLNDDDLKASSLPPSYEEVAGLAARHPYVDNETAGCKAL